jgi:hypothetical protein
MYVSIALFVQLQADHHHLKPSRFAIQQEEVLERTNLRTFLPTQSSSAFIPT